MKKQTVNLLVHLVATSVLAMLLSVSGAYANQSNSTSSSDQTDQVQKIYKSVGTDGQIIYSDTPSPGSEEITVPVSGGYKPVRPPAGFQPYQSPSNTKPPPANTLAITQPADQATIRSGEGTLSVSVSLSKDLNPQQSLIYQIDGATLYTGMATSHTFSNIFRGTHVLTVQLTDGNGSPISSQSVTFYMKRPFIKKK